MKRVVVKITHEQKLNWSGWTFVVNIDGEEYAKGEGPSYIVAAQLALGYVMSVSAEAE
jgi:hypothetical protein